MKNFSFALLICTATFYHFASAQWSINGNSGTNPPTNFLGTTDNKTLVFKTNNAERMRINSSGKVGIGVTSPQYKLDLGGDLNLSSGNVVRMGGTPVFRDNASLGNVLIGDNTSSASSGTHNAALGIDALRNNTSGYDNSAVGYAALTNNTGYGNSAYGKDAMILNISGYYNTALGNAALFSNAFGFNNTASGEASLYYTTGSGNTGNGSLALVSNSTGSNNTGIGNYSDVNAGNLSNATALGYNAIATASNQVMLGNTSVTSVMAAGSFVIYSDGRFKKNIQENVPGLEFINQLRPITYNYDIHGLNDFIGNTSKMNREKLKGAGQLNAIDEPAIAAKEKITYTGFIAQEVDEAAKKLGYDFSGVYHPANEHDTYGLSYADFVVPLVKAVQELDVENARLLDGQGKLKMDLSRFSRENSELKTEVESQKSEIEKLKTNLATFEEQVNSQLMLSTSTSLSINSAEARNSQLNDGAAKISFGNEDDSPLLGQNLPNPFDNSTIIPFRIPKGCASAAIVVTESSTGKLITAIPVTCDETHALIDAGTLTSGNYSYTLYVDGKMIDTKSMEYMK